MTCQVVEQVAALDVDDLVVARRRVLVDREIESRGRATRAPALAEDIPGQEVGDGLVREWLVCLVVADDPVEPLVPRLVVDEVGQVRRADARRDPSDRPLHP